MRPVVVFALALLLAGILGGCLNSSDPDPPMMGIDGGVLELSVVKRYSQDPLAQVQVVALQEGVPLLVASTNQTGNVVLHLPAGVDALVLDHPGYASKRITPVPSAETTVEMAPGVTIGQSHPVLGFRSTRDLGSQTYPIAVGTACLEPEDQPNQDCGLGEPSIEVDADGTIYLTGVCCIGAAPPVLVSRDDGESFQYLETPLGLREAFGIEGDFAIDQDGVIYFIDIELAATFQVTAWDKEGTFLHHTKWPAPPLVDRPWIRAEGSGGLYYVYNTGSSTNVYTSDDGGRTWSPTPVFTAPFGLGNAVSGPQEGSLWVIGGSSNGNVRAEYTEDGGATWTSEVTTAPAGGAQSVPVGFFDEGGNLYIAEDAGDTITVARRDADGAWQEPMQVSPEIGAHRFAWLAAGDEGKVAVAWYGTLDETVGADSPWYLFTALSLDAHSEHPHWAVVKADPDPVLVGDLQRQLLDFLQVEIGPDDAIHIGYSKQRADEKHEQLHYVQSDRSLPISPKTYFWGPR